jgi:hypothetical protein
LWGCRYLKFCHGRSLDCLAHIATSKLRNPKPTPVFSRCTLSNLPALVLQSNDSKTCSSLLPYRISIYMLQSLTRYINDPVSPRLLIWFLPVVVALIDFEPLISDWIDVPILNSPTNNDKEEVVNPTTHQSSCWGSSHSTAL